MHSGNAAGWRSCGDHLPVLDRGLHALGLRLTAGQRSCLVAYGDALRLHNRHLNLTAITDPEGVVRRHILDSLTVVLALPADFEHGHADVIDVGTGGGVPGLVLAIAFPCWRVTLLDSVAKKVQAIGDIVQALALDNVTLVPERAETVGRGDRRERHTLAVARAVAPLDVLVEYCAPLVRPGGHVVLYKSLPLDAELAAAEHALTSLRCHLDNVVPVPEAVGVGADRALVVLSKTGATPPRFPRRVGVPRSRPL